MGSTINFTGLTGFDTQAIVDALINRERQPLELIQQEQATIQQRINLFNGISSKLSSLESSISKLSTRSTVDAKDAVSSNDDVITASATAFTPVGAYTISEITQLATTHSEAFTAIADKAATFVSGTTFDFTVNSTNYSIDVSALDPSEQTLDGLASAINTEAGDDVSAVVINTGDADDPYKLVLQSKETGADSQITGISTDIQVTTSSGTAALATVPGEQVLGKDASFVFNGITITRDSNTVDDLVEGLTLNLQDETNSPVTITVSRDTSAIQADLEAFIEDYNSLNQDIQAQFQVDPETGFAGPLSGDFTLRQIQSTLQSIIVSGVTDADGNRYSIGSIGVDIDKTTGDLSLDTDRFNDAINNEDKELFLDLLTDRGVASNTNVRFVTSTDETQTGEYSLTITGTDGNGNVEGFFSLDGNDFTGVGNGTFLTGPEGTAAEGLRVEILNGATGSLGTISYSQGVAAQLERAIDDFITPITGLLPKLEGRLEDDIENLNDQILAFEERLAERERILTNQFLAAEEAIAALQAQQSAFNAQAANL